MVNFVKIKRLDFMSRDCLCLNQSYGLTIPSNQMRCCARCLSDPSKRCCRPRLPRNNWCAVHLNMCRELSRLIGYDSQYKDIAAELTGHFRDELTAHQHSLLVDDALQFVDDFQSDSRRVKYSLFALDTKDLNPELGAAAEIFLFDVMSLIEPDAFMIYYQALIRNYLYRADLTYYCYYNCSDLGHYIIFNNMRYLLTILLNILELDTDLKPDMTEVNYFINELKRQRGAQRGYKQWLPPRYFF